MNSTKTRLHVVDALRGFAIVSIILLHNIEHFDFYYFPSILPGWMKILDKGIWKSLFFLFSGKSYAIFALLFGLTFFIQFNNQEKKGKDFRGRFAWRLILLLIFGIINSSFFQGDILTLYAIIGFFLIPVAKLSNKIVFLIALILMLQPYEWISFFISLQNLNIKISDPVSWSYGSKMGEYVTGNSLIKTIIGNLTNGKTGVLYWWWESGRVFQTLSLFMFGMLAGRKGMFEKSQANRQFWHRIIIISSILFVFLFIVKHGISKLIGNNVVSGQLLAIEISWLNMAFMLILVSGFTLLYQKTLFHQILNIFSSIGRMSLSNYIFQSIVGSFIYYGFGLGLYQYTGATYCLLIGIVLTILEGYFSLWWIKYHNQGPLEGIWHRATWISFGKSSIKF